MKPLRGGLRLDGKKEASLLTWTAARVASPRRVRIPLGSLRPLVQEGARVRVGEKIAEGNTPSEPSLPASISGTISRIDKAIEILSDGKEEMAPGIGTERPGWESLPSRETASILQNLGVALPPVTSLEALLLNGCESEPYLTSDHSLMMSHPVEILRAGEILKRLFGAQELILALEDNKEEVAELFKSKIFFHAWSEARVELLPSRYPQGNERILAEAFLGRPIPPGRHPWEEGVLVQSMAGAYAVYEAVILAKPFYERIVTLGGACLVEPRNVWIRAGTLVEEAVKYARGFLREPGKVILGGPMTGTAIETLDVPILLNVPGVLALPPETVEFGALEPCIRCGLCVESCPASISPALITLAVEKGLFDLAEEHGARWCIECGNCSYVCPAKRPMLELLQSANGH